MTPLPKRRSSTARKGKRRANLKLKLPQLVLCSKCQQPRKPHQACPHCGHYSD